jgi:hypothetical protein
MYELLLAGGLVEEPLIIALNTADIFPPADAAALLVKFSCLYISVNVLD